MTDAGRANKLADRIAKGSRQVSELAAIVRVLFHGVIVTLGPAAAATGATASISATAPAGIKLRVKLIRPPLDRSSVRSIKPVYT